VVNEPSSHEPLIVNLEPAQSVRALERIRRDAVTVSLSRLDKQAPQPIGGRITTLRHNALEIEVDACGDPQFRFEPGSRWLVQFELGNDRFGFEADAETSAREAARWVVTMRRPERIWVRQRRRFRRANLRESSTVTLTTARARARLSAALLNVSLDGLACRATRHDSAALKIGDVMSVEVRLQGEEEAISADADLRGKALAANPDDVILRLQFVPTSLSAEVRRRIVQATCVIPTVL